MADIPVLLLTTHLYVPASDSLTPEIVRRASVVLLGPVETGSHCSSFDSVIFFCQVYVNGSVQLAPTLSVRSCEAMTVVSTGCS